MEIIAFYLPQYHPTPHNDEWWGEGFTEWTNVAKAKPLFPGHYQPKVPADLGFYDLRMPEVREKQAELAREAGVTAFCYYHYWFGNGHQELELPFKEVVERGKPDFPFCLCWANESWYKKFWNKDGDVSDKQDLAIQKYLGADDDRIHFMSLLSAFKDKRYKRVDGKLLFVIYRPLFFEDIEGFIKRWNKLAEDNGLERFYFVGYTYDIDNEYDDIKGKGFDAVCSCRLRRHKRHGLAWAFRKALNYITKIPEIYSYKNVYPTLIGKKETELEDAIPTLIPNWDHTPRSGNRGYLFQNCKPEFFEKHCEDVLGRISMKAEDKQIAFLKSWNEWGEGNYMEPDLRYGKGYINALRQALLKLSKTI